MYIPFIYFSQSLLISAAADDGRIDEKTNHNMCSESTWRGNGSFNLKLTSSWSQAGRFRLGTFRKTYPPPGI